MSHSILRNGALSVSFGCFLLILLAHVPIPFIDLGASESRAAREFGEVVPRPGLLDSVYFLQEVDLLEILFISLALALSDIALFIFARVHDLLLRVSLDLRHWHFLLQLLG